MTDFRRKTLAALKWTGLTELATQSFQFGVQMVLARLLSPHDYGLLGMILVFNGLASLFSTMGLGPAIIHRQELDDRHLSSVFWLNVACGVGLSALMALAAAPIARFYREPALTGLAVAVGANFMLGSLAIVQRNLLEKRMEFRKLFVVETAAIVASGAVAIRLAFAGWGAWSLVAQTLTLTGVNAALLWLVSSWRPAWRVDLSALRDVFHFSVHFTGSNILIYSNRNLDNLLIGRFVGSDALGLYTRAYTLMLLPLTEISNVVSRVMFPALSAIQHDIVQVKAVYLRATRMIALATFPLTLGLFATAPGFVRVVLGGRWLGVVPIIRVLCFAGLEQSVSTTVSWIYNSQGRTDLRLRWEAFSFFATSVAFVVGLRWGVLGVAAAYVLNHYLVLLVPLWTRAGRLIGLTFVEMAANVGKTLACAAAMSAAVWGLGHAIPPSWPAAAALACEVLAGIAVYVALLHLTGVEAYREALLLAGRKIAGRSSALPGLAP